MPCNYGIIYKAAERVSALFSKRIKRIDTKFPRMSHVAAAQRMSCHTVACHAHAFHIEKLESGEYEQYQIARRKSAPNQSK